MESYNIQICPVDEYQLFEPSSSPLGHSQVAPDPPWPQDGAAMVGVAGSCTNQTYPGVDYRLFEPSSIPLGHSQVASDPPWSQDCPGSHWLGFQGNSPAKAVQGISTDYLSHLAALYVTLKWLQTLHSPKIGL